jgi:hypothetical protein
MNIWKITKGLSLFLILGALALSPAYAGMGGSSGGNSSGGGMGSDSGSAGGTGGMSGSQGMGGSGASEGVQSGQSSWKNTGAMPMISSGGLGSGDATIELKPSKYKDGRLEVKFYANTHSVSLGNYDLMKSTMLEYNGRTYKPVKSDRLRGHHANGKMIFEVDEKPDSFKIVIKGVPSVEERVFEWK